jgi:hypothetical protein
MTMSSARTGGREHRFSDTVGGAVLGYALWTFSSRARALRPRRPRYERTASSDRVLTQAY